MCRAMLSSSLALAHALFGKPVPTFPEHALSPQPVETGEAVVDTEQQQCRGEQNHRDRGRETPRQQVLDLLVWPSQGRAPLLLPR